ncbi:hypothetical protein NNJEOMEG_02868 [Fundidesulfovibrio magnetotacticus]|uniref:Uncharacterized protein n=1 Tax=Fundidesulfovibrio magnetotacticus TaxID=2730080 RepID=A0A6V8LVR3_9BACT|nr:YkgJ family cysteine cluster protein [Fundidesulfovibrio magnetotacticus]GFK95020.1 hypothetical protein NNJEOMEG_02868 [Fundidesulfovibrio magnetotacticus]
MATPYSPRSDIPPWLPHLLKAQALMDAGVRLAAREESALRGELPACRMGCAGCCASTMPRATPVEMAGALRSLARQRPDALRLVSDAMEDGRSGGACPFLVEEGCLVYPMRFLSCRQLLVFGRSCLHGENPLRTRPSDVLVPLRRHAGRAYALLLPFLGEGSEFADPQELEAALVRHLRPVSSYGVRDCLLRDAYGERQTVRAA